MLTTLRPDGRPHAAPVGVTVDVSAGVAESLPANPAAKWPTPLRARVRLVLLCRVDGGRWATLEGVAEVCTDEATVQDAVARYGERYGRTPAPDPERAAIRILIEQSMGQALPVRPRPSVAAA
ncbi:pyridoxamine 5'-phosphate oxidase family protein [Streptomyces sp. NRRL F-5630]|uniref:pyridoxamine 5'-phosphate oxidase family protein n=1 Tax=Streptomyces sp. NRRL F-5630 TaxID=1463864 RepID=UPI003D74175A